MAHQSSLLKGALASLLPNARSGLILALAWLLCLRASTLFKVKVKVKVDHREGQIIAEQKRIAEPREIDVAARREMCEKT